MFNFFKTKEVKPIIVIKLPENIPPELSDEIVSEITKIPGLKDDYFVLIFSGIGSQLSVQGFCIKDLTEAKFGQLKKVVSNAVNTHS